MYSSFKKDQVLVHKEYSYLAVMWDDKNNRYGYVDVTKSRKLGSIMFNYMSVPTDLYFTHHWDSLVWVPQYQFLAGNKVAHIKPMGAIPAVKQIDEEGVK